MNTEGTIHSKGIYCLVKATRDGKPVILKGLKKDYRDKPSFQTLLKKEYERQTTLDNAHLAKYLDLTDVEGYGKCIVMEHIDGRNLTAWLQENHTTDEKLDIIRQVCDALACLHAKNVMHRNLKASNILVTRSGDQVKVIDIRPPFADDLHVGYSSMVHIAPEQKDGTVAIDGRADIFSLGVVMREMALPAEYTPIIEKCASYSRGDRYMDVADLLADLDNAGHASPARKPWIVGAIAVLAIAAVILIIGRVRSGSGTTGQPAATETATTDRDTTQQQPAAKAGPQDGAQPASSPDTDLAFLDNVKNQMFIDIDKMFEPYLTGQKTDRKALNRQVARYYKGLLRTFGPLTDDQRAAYDKVFGDYVAQKRQQLPVL